MSGYDGTIKFNTKIDDSQLKPQMSKLGTTISGLSKALGAVGITASLAAITTGMIKMSKASIQAASDAEETGNKYRVVFSDVMRAADAAADNLVKNYGKSRQAAESSLADTADLLEGLGATQEEAIKAASTISTFAVDLASYTDVAGGAANAQAALNALFTGERERVKAYGMAINETDLKNFAKEQGLAYDALSKFEKGMVSLKYAMKQSENSLGDFNRSSDSYANVSRVAAAATDDLSAAMGERLMPHMTSLKKIYIDILQNLTDMIRKENDLRDSRKASAEAAEAVADGTATENQQLRYLEDTLADVKAKGKIVTDQAIALNSALAEQERLGYEVSENDKRRLADLLELNRQYGIEIRSLQARINAIREGQTAEEQAAAEEAARLAAEEAAAKEREKWTNERIRQQGELAKEFAEIAEKEKLYGDEYDAQAARRDAVQKVLNEMIEFGFTAEGDGIRRIMEEYSKYLDYIENTGEKRNYYQERLLEQTKDIVSAQDMLNQAVAQGVADYASMEGQIKRAEEAAHKLNKEQTETLGYEAGLTGYRETTVNRETGEMETGGLEGGTEIGNLVTGVGSMFETLGNGILKIVTATESFEKITKIMNPLQTILEAAIDVLDPVISDLLDPLVGILTVLGTAIGQILTPAIQTLQPVIEFISQLFVTLYNTIAVPVGNAIIKVFNAVLTAINWVISAINDALGWLGINLSTLTLASSLTTITISDLSSETQEYAEDLSDANEELQEYIELLTSASMASALYDKELTGVTETVSSFYESLQDLGTDITDILIDSLVDGMDGDDFLFAIEEYIREAVIQAAVFTETFMAEVAQIGTELAQAIASGADASTIASLKERLQALYEEAEAAAIAATEVVESAFGSYDVGTVSVQGDQLANIHDQEMILPSGIAEEARAAGIYIGPMSGEAGLSQQTINLNLLMNSDMVVDGEKLGSISYEYLDKLVGASYGS